MDTNLLRRSDLSSTSTLVLYKKVLEYERVQEILDISTSPELDRMRTETEEALRLIRAELRSRSRRALGNGWGE